MADIHKVANEGTRILREALAPKPEEVVEEVAEATEEIPEEEAELEEAQEEVEPAKEEAMTPKESALLREIARLKADRREQRVENSLGDIAATVEETEHEDVTPAEARLFTAWRNEALEEFTDKNPKYKTDPKLWERFSQEYSDRVPELVFAKRKGIPVTKALFKDRLHRVHLSLGEETSQAREEGKRELLKAQSAAAVMGAGAAKGSTPTEKLAPKKLLFSRNGGGFDAWKKNK